MQIADERPIVEAIIDELNGWLKDINETNLGPPDQELRP